MLLPWSDSVLLILCHCPVDGSKLGFSTCCLCPLLSVLRNRHLLNGGNCFVVTADRSENRTLFPASKGGKRIRSTPHWFSSLAEDWVILMLPPLWFWLNGAAWALAGWAPQVILKAVRQCGELLVWGTSPHHRCAVHPLTWLRPQT